MAMGDPRRAMIMALAALVLAQGAACQQAAPLAEHAALPVAPVVQSEPGLFARETAAFAFTYDYPADVVALPRLEAMLVAERDKALADLAQQAQEAQKDAEANAYPFNAFMLGVDWRVTGGNVLMLAMVAEISSYSGGAHGNTRYEALVWDRVSDTRIGLDTVFIDLPAALEPLRQPYCHALAAERRKRLGDSAGGADQLFDACPPLSELILTLYPGSNGKFDRIMFIAAPYVAGSYAEGSYEIAIPLPAASLDKVRAVYRAAFVSTGI